MSLFLRKHKLRKWLWRNYYQSYTAKALSILVTNLGGYIFQVNRGFYSIVHKVYSNHV
jgi:hypothetical protein